nr:ATP-binding protein [uncultured Desulfobacter sp.]
MEERVEKLENGMAKDPIQMVTEGVAHDFRNLLEAIRSRATTAKNLTGSLNRAQSLMCQIVQLIDQNTHVVDLLEQFADTRKCQKQVVDLNRVVEMIFEHAGYYMPDIILEFDLLGRSIPVAVDAEKISQAAGVLLENAYQALPESKGMIIVSTDIVSMVNGSCEFYGLPAGEYARLTVADNGSGMEKDVLTQVFTPYYTGENGCYPGRKGLGLTLAQNIVDSHGGTIDIWSTPGSGSAFSINLPFFQE